jgi:hypothetical protein
MICETCAVGSCLDVVDFCGMSTSTFWQRCSYTVVLAFSLFETGSYEITCYVFDDFLPRRMSLVCGFLHACQTLPSQTTATRKK